MNIPTLDQLLSMEVTDNFGTLVPVGNYLGVLTGGEVRPGKKAPYINIEATIHQSDDDDSDNPAEFKGRKVWRVCSFSDNAVGMPGGIAQLLQVTKPTIEADTPANELPAVVAQAVIGTPVGFTVKHEQIERKGKPQFNPDGSPEMKAEIRAFYPPSEAFAEAYEAESAGLDSDLPF